MPGSHQRLAGRLQALNAGQRSHRAWAETIHAEWTKLWTLASTGWLLLGAATVLAGRLILPGHGFTPANGYQLLSLRNGPDLHAACGSAL